MASVERVKVTSDEAEQRLDRWFRRRYPQLGHGRLERMLRKGEIRVDGARAKASDRLRAGQEIRVPPMPATDAAPPTRRSRPAVDLDADREILERLILHRDDAVIAIDKPPGLPVQGGSGQQRHLDAMLDALARPDGERPRLIHRLDKDTSGVLLLARTGRAAAQLGRSFYDRSAEKVYWAAAAGAPRPRDGRIKIALVKGPGAGGGEKMLCVDPDAADQVDGAKPAVTDYATIEALGERAAWLALRPVTGRTHQLRAHLGALGCPVVGDGKYATRRGDEVVVSPYLGGEISKKLHLHARRISLPHPDGGRLSVEAPLPEHMARTWSALGWRDVDAPEAPFEALDALLAK